MASSEGPGTRIGWIGTGRMGAALVIRLLEAGADVAVYNRTRAKAEALAGAGATVVDRPAWPTGTWCSPWSPARPTWSR